MEEKITFCPVCGSLDASIFLTCTDHLASLKKFTICSCAGCGFKYTSPSPTPSELPKYYQSSEYISHTDSKKGLINQLYQFVKKYSVYKKLKLVFRYKQERGNLLDFGCGTGSFLEACNKAGWRSFGIEPNDSARALAATKTPGKVFESIEELYNNEQALKFDVITLWHVLEHIPNLESWFDFINNRLKENGIVIIAVPNCNSHDALFFKEFWAAYDLPRHLWHFTPKTITDLFSRKGFKCLGISPMIFDSFYVSILSYKNRYGKAKFVASFWRGFVSNLKAIKDQKSYSSQIYIFQRK